MSVLYCFTNNIHLFNDFWLFHQDISKGTVKYDSWCYTKDRALFCLSKASGHTYLCVWYPPHAHSTLLILSTFNSFRAQVFYHVFHFSHIKPLYLSRKFHNGTISFSVLRLHSHWGPEETGHAECLQKPSSWETQRYAPKDSDRSKYVDSMGLSS